MPQSLLDLRAALECQEAMHRQCIFNKEAASRQCAAKARQMAAARIIFLWLCRRCLHARLACQISRQQQREAALARLQHEQECCARALQAEEERKQAAAAQAKAVADEANKRHQQAKAAIGEQCQQAASAWEKAFTQVADEQPRHKATAASMELALIEERHRHEASMWAAMSTASSLANEQRRHEASKLALALAELLLANEQHRHEVANQAAVLAKLALAKERRCHEVAMQTAMSAESSLANEHCRHKAAP
jgi:colicin import membrane protein